MKPSAEQRTQIKPGTIVQVDPGCELDIRGALLEIVQVHTWGIVGSAHVQLSPPEVEGKSPVSTLTGRPEFRLTWQHIELTGGSVAWNAKGERMKDSTPEPKHHA